MHLLAFTPLVVHLFKRLSQDRNYILTPSVNLYCFVDGEGVHYNTSYDSFEAVLVRLFDNAIGSTQHVPQLERFVLLELFWKGTLLLESVGAHEPHVEELRDTIR